MLMSTNLPDLTCFQLRKDFLLVLLVPVWTGSSDERWGAVEDRTGTWGNIAGLLSLLTAFCIYHTMHCIMKRMAVKLNSITWWWMSTVIMYFSYIKQDYHSLWWQSVYISLSIRLYKMLNCVLKSLWLCSTKTRKQLILLVESSS